MKHKPIISLALLFCLITFSLPQVQAQDFGGSLGIHPLNSKISWRTNRDKKFFMDFSLGWIGASAYERDYGHQVNQVEGYFRPSGGVLFAGRFINRENIKLYAGGALGITGKVPGCSVPIGIEFFPVPSLPQLSIGADMRPYVNYYHTDVDGVNSPYVTTGVAKDASIRFYFNRRRKGK